MKAILERSIGKLPQINICILYKNITGGYFKLSNSYIAFPSEEEQYSVIRKWLTAITSFPIKNSDNIKRMLELVEKDDDTFDKIFEEMKNKEENSEDEDIKLGASSIPGSFNIEHISLEQYKVETEKLQYGMIVPVGIQSPCKTKNI